MYAGGQSAKSSLTSELEDALGDNDCRGGSSRTSLFSGGYSFGPHLARVEMGAGVDVVASGGSSADTAEVPGADSDTAAVEIEGPVMALARPGAAVVLARVDTGAGAGAGAGTSAGACMGVDVGVDASMAAEGPLEDRDLTVIVVAGDRDLASGGVDDLRPEVGAASRSNSRHA